MTYKISIDQELHTHLCYEILAYTYIHIALLQQLDIYCIFMCLLIYSIW